MKRRSPSRRSRPFLATLACISLLALLSFFVQYTRHHKHEEAGSALLSERALGFADLQIASKRNQECRRVHHAKDKCAFIKANCPDEEAGLLSYLSLYYCHLPHAKPVAFVILTIWLGLLFTTIGIAASDFFCVNLSTIANILGMSESMAGVTFLAFGNGSPDVFSTFAAMNSHSGSLAIGELIGAAGFITAVVAGSMALVREFKVGKRTFVRDIGFFIVAASFTLFFLADGTLHLWECCVMIGFYLFYVLTVVVWHWQLGRDRRRREREAAARGHYLPTANVEIDVTEERGYTEQTMDRPYRDTDDPGATERGRSPTPSTPPAGHDAESDEARAIHLAAEMASSMRVIRPRGSRKNTLLTPIRPSLVGALEFRSALSQLQRSRDSSSRLMDLRRYSDEPYSDHTNRLLEPSTGASTPLIFTEDVSDYLSAGSDAARTRAASMNAADAPKQTDPAAFSVAKGPEIGLLAASPIYPPDLESTAVLSKSPVISLSPAPSADVSRSISPTSMYRSKRSNTTLAPPSESFPIVRHSRQQSSLSDGDSEAVTPALRLKIPPSPMLIHGGPGERPAHRRADSQSPVMPFPTFIESPRPMSSCSAQGPDIPYLILDGPAVHSPSILTTLTEDEPVSWWPYSILPDPYLVASTVFPTLCMWKQKTRWDKLVSVISAPSIFLLAITLPVVESESSADLHNALEGTATGKGSIRPPPLVPDSPTLEPEALSEWIRYRRSTESHVHATHSPAVHPRHDHDTAITAVAVEESHHHSNLLRVPNKDGSPELDTNSSHTACQDWTRWLVIVQIFTSPLFIIHIVWFNYHDLHPGYPIRFVLASILGSALTTVFILRTTTSTSPPRSRTVLCFLGFLVAISWIATIAGEVVGVLKAFGVILSISDAILGLTVFAVGNSLGDLVADMTVARLGYPVMALSACFGGPMLNILLGIGISGLYMTVQEARHKHERHPDRQYHYRPFAIEVSGTLMVSGITLLITLLGLLCVVPWNNWIMSRRIGWGLIILWAVSTMANLAVEASGVWD